MRQPNEIYILVACESAFKDIPGMARAIAEQWGDYLLKGE